MTNLLLPVRAAEGLRSVAATACLAAKSLDGFIEGYGFSDGDPDPESILAVEGVAWPCDADALACLARPTLEELEREFVAAVEDWGLGADGFFDGPAYRWRAAGPVDYAHLSRRARLFDACVVARPGGGGIGLPMPIFDLILFGGGCPLLVAPPAAPTSLGRRILVAWNGSAECARAIACGTPFLRRAEHVFVLEVDGANVPGPSSSEVAEALRRKKIAAQRRVALGGRATPGEIFLEEARQLGCDLLIKGAYTRSRVWQTFFGGATSHILEHADLPVLLAH